MVTSQLRVNLPDFVESLEVFQYRVAIYPQAGYNCKTSA
jgi:hypothetical protein